MTEPGVPQSLRVVAAWSWRLLAIGALLYFVVLKIIGHFPIVVIPFITAMLFAALLHPVKAFLCHHGFSRGWATFVTVIGAFLLLGGIGTYVVNRAINEYPQFVTEVTHLINNAEHWLITGPLKLNPDSVNNIGGKVTDYLKGRQGEIASGVVSAVSTIVEIGTGLILTLFLMIFFILEGDQMFAWFVGLAPERHHGQIRASGHEVWRTLTGYVGGTFLVALFHALALGIALGVTRVELVAPLVVLIFIGSFIPIIGMPIFGGLACLVALISRGYVVALVILIVLIVDNQIESHLLQPLVVGRYVHLHPVVIAITLTGGVIFAGLPGAIFGIPVVAGINAAVRGASVWRREQGEQADGGIEGATAQLAKQRAKDGEDPPPAERDEETPLVQEKRAEGEVEREEDRSSGN